PRRRGGRWRAHSANPQGPLWPWPPKFPLKTVPIAVVILKVVRPKNGQQKPAMLSALEGAPDPRYVAGLASRETSTRKNGTLRRQAEFSVKEITKIRSL